MLLSLAIASGCSNEEIYNPDEPGREEENIDISNDLLCGKLVCLGQYSKEDGLEIPIETREPVEYTVIAGKRLNLFLEEKGSGKVLKTDDLEGISDKTLILLVKAQSTISDRYRHFIVIARNKNEINDDEEENTSAGETKAPARTSSNRPEVVMAQSYGAFLGKGTNCYDAIGNVKRAVILSDRIDLSDQNLVTAMLYNNTQMFEKSGETFESTMEAWSVNAGLSFRGLGKDKGKKWAGSLNFQIGSKVNTSNDFEYYLNVYKVIRGELAYNMPDIVGMSVSNDTTKVNKFMSFIATGFINDLINKESANFNPTQFFEKWGTDIIYQAQLGGYNVYLYGRESNAYETSIGTDATLSLKAIKPTETPTDGQNTVNRQWLDIYRAKNSPYIGGDAGFSYQNSEYFSASRSQSYSMAMGGNPAVANNPTQWIAGFNDIEQSGKWSPISYRRYSDNSINDDKWLLYPIEDMAAHVADAVEKYLGRATLSEEDQKMINNARANAKKLAEAKYSYVDGKLTHAKAASQLVLCDVMMKYNDNKQKSGDPKPFVAKDPRDNSKMRVYYPMMANKYFDKKRKTEKQRGRAIDTNVDCFISSAHRGSHYWYYALAHEDDCDGIVDIIFRDYDEDYFSIRGDCASNGPKILNCNVFVRVKYFDAGVDDPAKKIKAFGLYDDHKQVRNIIASTGGSELRLSATQSEQKVWDQYWGSKYVTTHGKWSRDAFYHGGGGIPHGIYVKFSTQPLPIDKVKKITHPEKW